ncbi:MAG: UbiA prenyltransferase family protein, partial [Phycisphaerae bacterium]|nr:UbiA prenyltransferase family protein [Phycisphaerae bacterium]
LISVRQAVVFGSVLAVLSLLPALLVSYHVLALVVIYAIMNLFYSLKLKHVAILDVMTIAAGFVLRILGGSMAITVAPSVWLVLCTIMISLFLGFAKRRAELVGLENNSGQTRIVLKDYSRQFLDQVIAMVTAATLICYTLYTVDAHTVELFGSRAMLLTAPSVIYGICRYLYLIYHQQKGGDPVMTVLRDIPSLVNLAIWTAIALLVISYGSKMGQFLPG